MNSGPLGITVVACVLVLAQPAVPAQTGARLLRPGTFGIEPPFVAPTEEWLGLRERKGEWEVVRVVPQTKAGERVCGKPATQIIAEGEGRFIILFTGVENVSQGPVTTAVQAPRTIYPGEQIDIGGGHLLEALGSAFRESGGVILVDYTLRVRRGEQSQLITSFDRSGLDNPRQILWAGDIDRDTRPDLLFDFPEGDVGHRYVLYMSNRAGQGPLVREVATFTAPGC